LFPYFHSVSAFSRKSQKVSAPLSSLIEAIEGSGYEGEEDSHVTPLHDKGRKKRSCTYSLSPSTSPGMDVVSSSRVDLLINITEKKEKI
jgi:hypothetical protein